jgi:hypothetical protein
MLCAASDLIVLIPIQFYNTAHSEWHMIVTVGPFFEEWHMTSAGLQDHTRLNVVSVDCS